MSANPLVCVKRVVDERRLDGQLDARRPERPAELQGDSNGG